MTVCQRTDRQRRAVLAVALAPVAPPCFSSRSQWAEYVAAAAIDQRDGHLPGPLLLVAGKPARFNPHFSFCAECDDSHAQRMAHVGKCKPRHLIELAQPRPAILATSEAAP